MMRLNASLLFVAGAVTSALCSAPGMAALSAPIQTTPAPAPPPARPVTPLANPNIDEVYLNIRNGNLRAQPVLGAPYARALSFVSCSGSAIKAQPILATDFGSRTESKLVDQAVRRSLRCGEAASGVPVFLLRAAVSESVLRKHTGEVASPAASGASESTLTGIDAGIDPMLGNVLRVAQCQARSEGAAMRRVLGTKPGSPDEQSAQANIFSSTPQCGGKETAAGMDSVAYRAVIANVLGRELETSGAFKN